MKHTFKYYQYKLLMSIKGWFKEKKLQKNSTYVGGPNNCYSIYRGNRTFYEQKECLDKLFGAQFLSTSNKTYPYWQLGLFNWKKINAIIIE